MSVAQEFLTPEHIPMAAMSAQAGILAVGGFLSACIAANSLSSHIHRKLDRGHVGVWLDKGQPRIREGIKDDDITDETDYVVVGPGSYWFRPIATDLRDVNVAPRPLVLTPENTPPIRVLSKEGRTYTTHVEILWRVRPDGNNPVKSIINVETNQNTFTNNTNKDIELERAMRQETRSSFSKAAGGIPQAKLERMHNDYLGELTEAVIEDSRERASELGSEVLAVMIDQFTPVDAQILADGMRDGQKGRISRPAMVAVANAINEVGLGGTVHVGDFANWQQGDAAA
jgi:hypothetical protein